MKENFWVVEYLDSLLLKYEKLKEKGIEEVARRHWSMGKGFPGGSGGKASVYNTGDLGSIPGLGRFPGEGNGKPLQYCCLENPMDRGAW